VSASIVAGVDVVLQRFGVDRRRVFVTGLSAGAAMSAALLASSPDVFSAGSIFAGLPAGCATTSIEALTCMQGIDLTPRKGHH
jgi:feruloyl esterase